MSEASVGKPTSNAARNLLATWQENPVLAETDFHRSLYAVLRGPLSRGARDGLLATVGRRYSGQDLEDAMSEGAIAVFESDPLEIEVGLENFAYGVAFNKARVIGRKLNRSHRWVPPDLSTPPDPLDFTINSELSDALDRCWRALEHKQRDVIEYVRLNEGTYRSWANINGGSPEAARRRCERGQARLRKCLDEAGAGI